MLSFASVRAARARTVAYKIADERGLHLFVAPIRAITAPVVLNALRSVEQRGRLDTARRIRQRISAVFAFAMAEDMVNSDPAAIVGRALMPSPPKRNPAALLEIDDARAPNNPG